jgi:hypothetical protein
VFEYKEVIGKPGESINELLIIYSGEVGLYNFDKHIKNISENQIIGQNEFLEFSYVA